jgi:cytochrome c oxidase assembly protein subunit 15
MLDVPVSTLLARIPTPSRATQRVLAIAALITQAGVATAGSVVRVTGSGLGCPTWPQCAQGSLVPIANPVRGQLHQWIEFGNRLFGASVGIIGVLVFLAVLLNRPRRKRYILLALTMPLGVVVQALLGGITVLMKLDWWTVTMHFLPSPVLVWLGVLLVVAVGEGDRPAQAVIPRSLRGMQVAMTVVLGGLLIAGTLVTAAGPHAGDARTPRLGLPVADLAQFHSDFLFVFLGMLVALGFAVRITGGTRKLWRAYWWLVAATLAQGALGITQYFLGVPDVLVSLHVLGSMLVTAAMAWLWCASRDRGPAPSRSVDPGEPVTDVSATDVTASAVASG